MILCSHKKYVDKYNDLLIHRFFQPHEIFTITLDTNATGVENVKNWLNDSKCNHFKYVVIGAKVMITKKLNILKGAINGAIATITSYIFDDNEIITSIIIKVLSTNATSILSKPTLQHKYTYEAYFYKTSFPIVLTYVITSHKTQGVTITPKVLIDVRESFAPSFTYVMLSRVINCVNLIIHGN